MEYTTREGDTVANIAWNHYGTSAGYTEQILTAPENYGLIQSSLPPCFG